MFWPRTGSGEADRERTGNPEDRGNSEFCLILYAAHYIGRLSGNVDIGIFHRREIGWSFLNHFAPATLDHDGKPYYFISEEARREFAKRPGLTL